MPVTLRPATAADLPLIAADSDPDLDPLDFYGYRHAGRLDERFAANGLLGERDGLLVVDVDGEVAGSVGWITVQHGPTVASTCHMIGIRLDPAFRGRGVGTAAQGLAVAYLFSTTRSVRIEAGTDVENVAERRSLEKVGFTLEGILRRSLYRDGDFHDQALYSLLRGELKAASAAG
jgi:RimJ/RimL family protein N-acetyltransferase